MGEARLSVHAEPYEFEFDAGRTALLVIDMQRDFVDPGGFGEQLGNDVSLLRRVVAPLKRVLEAMRAAGYPVIHTREGHLPDLSDCPPSKIARGHLTTGIGDVGPMGRILVRGSYGHDIIDELKPVGDETVIDKPGKGAFFATDLDFILRNRNVTSLVVTGVTTEVCVNTTVREANDRGYECLILADATGATDPANHDAALHMVTMQGGVFGAVATSTAVIEGTTTHAG